MRGLAPFWGYHGAMAEHLLYELMRQILEAETPVEQLADLGPLGAVTSSPELARGINTMAGKLTYEAVAEAHGMEYTPLDDALAALVA